MRFADEPDAVYVEGPCTGSFIEEPSVVRRCRDADDPATAAGLPSEASLALVDAVATVRGSKDPQGPALVFAVAAWAAFVDAVGGGRSAADGAV